MCGLKPHADAKLDGFDQSGTLLGKPSPRDRVFCHFPHGSPNQAVSIPGFLPGTYVRKGDWKLIRFYADNDDGSDRFELYDLKHDIGESKNLAAEKPQLVRELNELINGFLKDTEAVVPVRNPNYKPATAQPAPGKKTTAKADMVDALQGWKARNCTATVKNGIVTLTGTGAAPFLGVGAGMSGPATVKFRARSAVGGAGKVEWLSAAAASADAKSTPFTLAPGDWQEISASIPASGLLGIVRIYLPAQKEPVELDWVEFNTAGKPKRWDF